MKADIINSQLILSIECRKDAAFIFKLLNDISICKNISDADTRIILREQLRKDYPGIEKEVQYDEVSYTNSLYGGMGTK